MSSATVNLSLSLSLVGIIWSGSGSDTGYSQQTVDVHHVCSLSTHSALQLVCETFISHEHQPFLNWLLSVMEYLVQTPVTHAPLPLKNAYSTWPLCKGAANSYNFMLVGSCCSNSLCFTCSEGYLQGV